MLIPLLQVMTDEQLTKYKKTGTIPKSATDGETQGIKGIFMIALLH
jgi:hypothetical protein